MPIEWTVFFMPLDRSLKRWEIALMAGVLCALLCGFWLGEEQTQLADRVIRFHVIANSDTPEDQAQIGRAHV